MKKLLLILLCLPMIGFGQMDTVLSDKSKILQTCNEIKTIIAVSKKIFDNTINLNKGQISKPIKVNEKREIAGSVGDTVVYF